MSTQDLKPALCILNPDDVYNLKNNHAEDSYYCITPYEALEMQSRGITFPVEPHLQEGLVLTREPHGRGYYYRTDETDCRVINERCLAIEAILSYLGGKEFRYSETSSFRSKHSADIDVELGGCRHHEKSRGVGPARHHQHDRCAAVGILLPRRTVKAAFAAGVSAHDAWHTSPSHQAVRP